MSAKAREFMKLAVLPGQAVAQRPVRDGPVILSSCGVAIVVLQRFLVTIQPVKPAVRRHPVVG
jgi:hypothetical protein